MAVVDGAQQGAPEVENHSAGGLLPGLWKFQLLLQFLGPGRRRQLLRGLVGTLMSAVRLLPPTKSTGKLSLTFALTPLRL